MLVVLIVVLVILALVALWVFDVHKAVYVKLLSQNAGDAAALAAARWQAITLNLIGDLNIMQAVALSQGDTNEAVAINELQARLCYVGPMVAFVAAQQAAKNNGIFNNDRFTERVREHARWIGAEYLRIGPDGQPLFPEPYPGCWQDYIAMLEAVAEEGVAAGPDNARLHGDYAGEHVLLDESFYDAVAGQDWCWFYLNHPDLLEAYTSFLWWPPLPDRVWPAAPVNGEFFGLGLTAERKPCGVPVAAAMDTVRRERRTSASPITAEAGMVTSVWYCYDSKIWTRWLAFAETTNRLFPAAGPVKPQYDYAGADAAVRVEAQASRSMRSRVEWTAAAKPFGFLDGGRARPDALGVVLPAFHDVRLIPVDAASGPSGVFKPMWREHIEIHLPEYLQAGLAATRPGCSYCHQLRTWEQRDFRQSGLEWLRGRSGECRVRGGPGGPGHRGGGTRRGH